MVNPPNTFTKDASTIVDFGSMINEEKEMITTTGPAPVMPFR